MDLQGDEARSAFPPRGLARVVALLALISPCLAAGAPRPKSAPPAEPGSLRGSVVIGPELEARRIRFSLYPDLSGGAPNPAQSGENEIRNVVLYLTSPELSRADDGQRHGPYRIEQRDESFLPHVLAVVAGSTVEFTNADPIYHNVFSLSKAASFDLGRYRRGASRAVRFDRPGVVKVFCHIHSDMSAVVLVLDNPYFASPGPDGGFTIRGIPPGTYTATAWHERARPIQRQVTIAPGRTADVDFTIPLQDLAEK